MDATPHRPIVFISANRLDDSWRERLKAKLEAHANELEWWDDSKIQASHNWEREIEVAIRRASVAVVLLSPNYLSSDTAVSELTTLGQRSESTGLKLFPIVLEECAWKQFTFLRLVQVWAGAKPIGHLSGDAAESELDKIARSIVDLVTSEDGSPAASTQPEFTFSKTAEDVLKRARELAKESGRAETTSSCALFALADRASTQPDTARFVRDALDYNKGYEAAFEAFLHDTSFPGEQSGADGGKLLGEVSSNMQQVLQNAAAFAERVSGRSREIHQRHLFAALLVAPDSGEPLVARNRLKKLGLELPRLRRDFREYIRGHAAGDNAAEWDAILIPSEPKQPESLDGTAAYRDTYSSFVPDRAAYGSRATDTPLDDALSVGVYAGHLAQLIAAKETWMPLSIGLFGAWGAGKSHFIDLLDEQLRALTRQPGKVFYQQIVQIRFNAWHYLDTNLWANLVCEIFDQLFAKLDERKDTTVEEVTNLKKRLADQSALAAEAKVALDTAEKARTDAEEKLRLAMQQRAASEKDVGTLLDDLSALVLNNEKVQKQLSEVASGLGLPKLEKSFAELEARASEVRSLSGRTKALVLAIFTGPGWWMRGLLLAVALALPLGIAWLANNGAPWIRELLAGAGGTIAQVVVAITGLSAWLSSQAKAGNAVVNTLETAYDQVKDIRDAREAKDDAATAKRALAAKRQAEEEARHTLREAEEKMKTIRAELAELAPGRQLIRFLKERASAEDYRQHLGLVSLVRRDFEQLSKLLTSTGDATDGPLPKIDRIVLYIDDLDRCRADRVIEVLEAVHLLLAFPLFAVVVAVDPRWLRQSLLDHYPRLLGGPGEDGGKIQVQALARPATPQDYLEKIFQVPFNLQAMEEKGFKALVKQLFPIARATDVQRSATRAAPASNVAVETPRTSTAQRLEPTQSAPSAQAQGAVIEAAHRKEQTYLDPQRLALTEKEVADVERFQPLFKTPRAVKRLANTYCLVRVGVGEREWSEFLGEGDSPGYYRAPLLMLAVTSAFPALARPWLQWLIDKKPTRWQLGDSEIKELTTMSQDTTDGREWAQLGRHLSSLGLGEWPVPNADLWRDWVPRVARYSF